MRPLSQLSKILMLPTFIASLIPLLVNGQSIPLYGSSLDGGSHGIGGFFELYQGSLKYTPYKCEVTYPTTNFISSGGKIYGLAGVLPFDLQSPAPVEQVIIEMDGVDKPAMLVSNKATNRKYGLRRNGFTVYNNQIIATSREYLIRIDLGTYAVDTLDALDQGSGSSAFRPLVHDGKCYYGKKNVLLEKDLTTGVTRSVSTSIVGVPEGDIKVVDGKLILTTVNTGTRNLYIVDITTGAASDLGMVSSTTSLVNGQMAVLNGKVYYSTILTSSTYGELVEVDVTATTKTSKKVFDAEHQKPIFGLVEFNGNIYGLLSEKSGAKTASVFRYDPISNQVTIIKEIEAVDNTIQASSLLVHDGGLYIVGERAGANGKGALTKLDIATGNTQVFDQFKYAHRGLGIDQPVHVNGKFYGHTDSLLHSYNISTGKISEEYNFSSTFDDEFDFHGLTKANGKLYGLKKVSQQFASILYSYDLNTFEYKEIVNIKTFQHYGEMVVTTKYAFVQAYEPKRIIRVDLNTLDTISTPYDPEGCDQNGQMCLVNNKLYFTTCSGGNNRGFLFELDAESMTITKDETFGQITDTVGYSGVVYHNSKLYSHGRVGDRSYLFSYDPVSHQYNRINASESTNRTCNALALSGNLLHWSSNSNDDGLYRDFVHTYDINSGIFETFEIEKLCNLTGTPLFIVSSTSGTTGIESLQSKIRANIYPNPGSEKIKISFQEPFVGTIAISDVNGKTILTREQLQATNNIEFELDILSSGYYTLRFSHVNGSIGSNNFVVNK